MPRSAAGYHEWYPALTPYSLVNILISGKNFVITESIGIGRKPKSDRGLFGPTGGAREIRQGRAESWQYYTDSTNARPLCSREFSTSIAVNDSSARPTHHERP
jgi:hypothetical protein